MPPTIKEITLADGSKRFRFVVDAGVKPNGKRRQVTRTLRTKREAQRELNKILHTVATGTYVAPDKITVDEWLDRWLKSATVDVEHATAKNYADAVRPVRERLGGVRLQQLADEDIEGLVDWMLTCGRKQGGRRGTPLGARTVELTLGRLRAALNLAVQRGLVTRNVAAFTKIPKRAREEAKQKRRERLPWGEEEVQAFLAGITDDRLFAVMLLSLCGLRPEEVCGLRWEDVDLDAGTIAVVLARTMVGGRAVEKATKTAAGRRTLPLPRPVWNALRRFKALQAQEKLAAGDAYQASGYVLMDELGRPWKTDRLRRAAYGLMAETGARKVRLYDARHACLSWMSNNGVPASVVSAWAGHADLGFTLRHYVHADPESLRVGADRLGELLG